MLVAQGKDWMAGDLWAAFSFQRARETPQVCPCLLNQRTTRCTDVLGSSLLSTNFHPYLSAKLGDRDHIPVSPTDQGLVLLRPFQSRAGSRPQSKAMYT